MELHAFPTVAIILAMATIGGLLASRLRQPLIVAFVVVGIAVGPVGTGWVATEGTIELLARLGISILLFVVGLRLDLNMIRSTGPVAVATGLGQVVLTCVVGDAIARALGMDNMAAMYIGAAMAFSSTIIIVKLLTDRHELDQLHGRIAVSFLIVQDILVVLAMIALTAFGRGTAGHLGIDVAIVLLKGIALIASIWLLMRFVLPWLLPYIAQSQDLLVLFGVSYAVTVAAASEWLGFSAEVGAFLAGVSLASTPYRDALGARLASIRDFLLLFFFLDLGARLEFADITAQMPAALILCVLVLIGKPVIVTAIMSVMRYPMRVAVRTGLPTAQISEFSWVLAALGLSLGHITNATVSLVTIVGLVTITASTYMTIYSRQIYDHLARRMPALVRRTNPTEVASDSTESFDVILFGLGRFGSHIANQLCDAGHRVLAIDFDPHQIRAHTHDRLTTVFGSAEDASLLQALPLDRAQYVVSAIPALHTNLVLLDGLRDHQFEGTVAFTAHTQRDAQRLRGAGITAVLEPFSTAAQMTSDTLHELLTGKDKSSTDDGAE